MFIVPLGNLEDCPVSEEAGGRHSNYLPTSDKDIFHFLTGENLNGRYMFMLKGQDADSRLEVSGS